MSLLKIKFIFALVLTFCIPSIASQLEEVKMSQRKAVIVVDLQGDFTEYKQGSLAVPDTEEDYVRKVKWETLRLRMEGLKIIATQDWHPLEHISFYPNHPNAKAFDTIPLQDPDGASLLDGDGKEKTQVLWPPHCVQDTKGTNLLIPEHLIDHVTKKGSDPRFDSYSGFTDDGGNPTDLDKRLKELGITKLVIYGIAIDYCVKATVLDALKLGTYEVSLIVDLSRGVSEESSKTALEEMQAAGAKIYPSLKEYISCEN